MTTFVLVHGAWHGGWCYDRVARLLRGKGHDVYTPTLTGLGERSHLIDRSVNLSTHIDDVAGVLAFEDLSDVVLCGHSYGGMVISGVAEKAEKRIRSLVFLDAFVPESGKSLFDYVPSEAAGSMRADAAQNGEGHKVAPRAAEHFNVNAADRAWVDAMCVKHPIATFEEGVPLTGARERVAKRTFIQAKGYGRSPFGQFAEKLGGDPAWRVLAVPCGHDVMVDMPQELADLLIAAA
ncbi:MAG TPA: alpha/beta hydrolase family protein [Stellaceae bacterium]|nr:alpha/beta hydrolase family protein [Stellaceae bacterium]